MKKLTSFLLALSLSFGIVHAQTPSRIKGAMRVASGGKATFPGKVRISPEGDVNNIGTTVLKNGIILESQDTQLANSGKDGLLRNTGTLTLSAGQTVEVQKTFKGYSWTYFSVPFNVTLSSIVIDGQSNKHNTLYRTLWYDSQERANSGGKSANIWKSDHTQLEVGKGYSMGLSNATYPNGTSAKVTFSSNANNYPLFSGDANVPVAYKSDQNNMGYTEAVSFGWYYIGNPFTSNFTINTTNLTGYIGSVYIHTNGRADTDGDPADGFHAYQVNTTNRIVAPYSGLFIKISSSQSTLTGISFKRSGQTGKTTTGLLRSSGSGDGEEQLKILLRNSARCYDYCGISIDDSYSPGYNAEEDYSKMYSEDATAPQFWSLSETYPMDVNRVTTEESQGLPLGVKLPKKDTYTIAIKSDGLNANFESVQLFDKQENKQVDLLEENYVFTSDAMETSGRFFLMVSKQETSLNGKTTSPVVVYPDNGTIYVKNLSPNSLVQVYTLNGMLVSSSESESELSIPMPVGQVYIVKVVSGEKSQSFKVVNP